MKRFILLNSIFLGFLTITEAQILTSRQLVLYVVDGYPVKQLSEYPDSINFLRSDTYFGLCCPCSLLNLDPGDIKSVLMLSGHSAVAFFGIRAGNGAVLISTIKGSVNCGNRNMICTCRGSSGRKLNRIPEFQCAFMK